MDKNEVYQFVESYDKYPELAANIAADAEDSGESETVINFFETLGDTYIEDKSQALSMVEQVGANAEPTDAI